MKIQRKYESIIIISFCLYDSQTEKHISKLLHSERNTSSFGVYTTSVSYTYTEIYIYIYIHKKPPTIKMPFNLEL